MNSELGRKFASAGFIIGLFVLWEVLCIVFDVSDVIAAAAEPGHLHDVGERAGDLAAHGADALHHAGRVRARRRDRRRHRRARRLVEARL